MPRKKKEEPEAFDFNKLDKDGDGQIDAEEIMSEFKVSRKQADAMLKKLDKDGDGKIDAQEFAKKGAEKKLRKELAGIERSSKGDLRKAVGEHPGSNTKDRRSEDKRAKAVQKALDGGSNPNDPGELVGDYKGAKVKDADYAGTVPPLVQAAMNGHPAVVYLLLEYMALQLHPDERAAAVRAVDPANGNTALHYAADQALLKRVGAEQQLHEGEPAVHALIGAGAEHDAKNKAGWSAIGLAKAAHSKDMVHIWILPLCVFLKSSLLFTLMRSSGWRTRARSRRWPRRRAAT